MASRALSIKKLVRKISVKQHSKAEEDEKEEEKEMSVINDPNVDGNFSKKVNFPSKSEESQDAIPKSLKTLVKNNSLKSEHEKAKRKISNNETSRKCGVCNNQFQQPKMLPCNHTFCLECLERYVNPRQILGCPKCHQEVKLDGFGLDALPDNLSVARDARNGAICITCNRDCIVLGQLCLHCNKIYCKVCLRSHAQVLQEQYRVMKEHLEDTIPTIDTQARSQEEILDDLLIKADEAAERQIAMVKKKRKEVGEEIVKLCNDNKEEFETIKVETKALIDCLVSQIASTAGRDTADELKMISETQNTYQVVLQKLDSLKNKNIHLNQDTLTLSCKKKEKDVLPPAAPMDTSSTSIQRKKSKKLARTDSRPLVTTNENNYKNCHMEEVSKLRWSSCQQPLGSSICPWTGETWVCGSGSRDIAVFNQTSTCTQVITSNSFLFPCGIVFQASTRKAYVLDRRQHCIWVVGDTHEVEKSIGKNGSKQGCFSNPSALAMDSRGRLLVADTGNNRVQIIDTNGIFISYIGVYKEEGMSGSIHELVSPSALAISPDGKTVAVADSGNNRVRVYSVGSGRSVGQWGMRGRGHGQMERPMGLAWLGQGALVVLDEGRIQVFTAKGEFLRSLGVKESVNNVESLDGHLMMYDTNLVIKAIIK